MVYKVIVNGVVTSMSPNKSEARSDYFSAHSHPKQFVEIQPSGAAKLLAQTDWKGQTHEYA